MAQSPDKPSRIDDEWTPTKGLLRAAVAGVLWSIILAALLAPLAWHFPLVITDMTLRAAIGFGVAWILFGVVHRAAGMVGWHCNAMALLFTAAVMLSHHAIFAIHGVPLRDGSTLIGAVWFNPGMLMMTNIGTVIGVVVCTWLCHDGGADSGTLLDILNSAVSGTSR